MAAEGLTFELMSTPYPAGENINYAYRLIRSTCHTTTHSAFIVLDHHTVPEYGEFSLRLGLVCSDSDSQFF